MIGIPYRPINYYYYNFLLFLFKITYLCKTTSYINVINKRIFNKNEQYL